MPSQEELEEVDEEIEAQDDADAEAAETGHASYIPMAGLPPTSMPASSDLSQSHLPTHIDMRSLSRDPEVFHQAGIVAGGDY